MRVDEGYEIKEYSYEVVEAKRTPEYRGNLTLLAILFTALVICLVCGCNQKPVWAEVIDMHAIMTIESQGNPNAIGTSGEIGLFQIMPCVLADYNRYNASNLPKQALFIPEVNRKVAIWYLTKRIPQMLAYYHKAITTTNCIIAWNAGIGNLVKCRCPKSTREYIAKYNKLRRP